MIPLLILYNNPPNTIELIKAPILGRLIRSLQKVVEGRHDLYGIAAALAMKGRIQQAAGFKI